jgi:hypothetical protein
VGLGEGAVGWHELGEDMIQASGLLPIILQTILIAAISGAVGWLGATVTFKTKLALLEQRMDMSLKAVDIRITALQTEMQGCFKELGKDIKRMDKRQLIIFEGVADIAHSAGLDKRQTDLTRRFMATEAVHEDID